MSMWKKTGLVTLVVLGTLIPAAHLNRWYSLWEALAWAVPVACMAWWRAPFLRRVSQALMLAGSLLTVDTMLHFIRLRQAMGLPWMRLALILGTAALLTALAAWVLEHDFLTRRDTPHSRTGVGFAAWVLTLGLLAAVKLKAPAGMLLADRFSPGAGWLEASLLAVYAGFAAQALADPARAAAARLRLWGLFSLVFFGQLALGLAGFTTFLMSGTLHLPVPALIVAGPLFRGEGLFMLILFGATVLLVGPAWCSHLCYIGAWDAALAARRTPPATLPAWVRHGRMALAAAVFALAWGLGRLGLGTLAAAWLAALFGLCGVALMVFASRRLGVMVHCSGWCPMGLVAGLAGRLSPWRLRIAPGCKGCGLCSLRCRYDVLRPEDLARKRPGPSCSLCRDCLPSCPRGEISLTFFGLSAPWVTGVFCALLAALHAVFLGVARL